ncbi:MAG: ribosome silencing factor [Spirochaetaceae bacterium]|jgi:ribosome-associated protein|nr:ribosome silencing factor [Spirochaetaceae bacterium]
MDDLTDKARKLGSLLAEHNGKDVVVIDLRALASWTDFFIIVTVTSGTHRSGLERLIKEWTVEAGVETRRGGAKRTKDENWSLADLGSIVVHLMNSQAREFYELENLWSEGLITRIGNIE